MKRKSLDQDLYRRAFSPLHCTGEIRLEDKPMKKTHSLAYAFASAAAVFVLGAGSICYAADIGGFRTLLSGWVQGEKTNVEAVSNSDTGYEFYKEGESELFLGGGGVAYKNDKEVRLSAQEVLDMNASYVDKEEDGTIILYDKNFKADITDLFKNNKAKVAENGIYWDITLHEESMEYQTKRDGDPFDAKAYIDITERNELAK